MKKIINLYRLKSWRANSSFRCLRRGKSGFRPRFSYAHHNFSVVMGILPLCILMLNGCVVAAVGAGAAGGYYVATDERKAGEIASDASITSQINFKMLGDSRVSAPHVDVDTYNGVVTLSGDVPNAEAEDAVIEIAKSVRGVKRVESRLHIGR